ncbi:MlaE family lipid ABC transporter permease subunit [Kiloniella laminariae]|uniref:MlaE family lipid ABC transporter permease subunit n=1 Tax=Kiloniella laminariae TaxID=454162 RepID=UPI0003AA243A
MTTPQFQTSEDKNQTVIRLSGSWITQELSILLPLIETFASKQDSRVVLNLQHVEIMDSAGALLLHKLRKRIEESGRNTALEGIPDHVKRILLAIEEHHIRTVAASSERQGIAVFFAETGRHFLELCNKASELIAFLGLVITASLRQIRHPGRIRFTSLIAQMEQAGLHALPIVGLISFLIGVVLAFQGSDQLERFGAQIFTINLVAVGVLREMGILLTAIIVAGRSGSAFTAQIGTMKVNEEIDAMRTIGLDPIETLVLPRIFGLVLVLPLLTFYADIMGLIGGAAMTMVTLDLSLFQYLRHLQDAAKLGDFLVGMIKAPIFAFIIALIGCHEGLQVSRSAESVGRQTTRSVVEASFLIIVLDAMLSILFSILGV